MHVLIAGCGWLGQAVAQRLLERGDRVTGIRSHSGRAEALRSLGIEPLTLDLADPASVAAIPQDVEAILALQSAGGDGAAAYHRAYVEANGTLLAAARRNACRSFVYTGSTSVFGQRDGAEVDERTPPAPATATGHVLVEAERRLLAAAREGLPACLVRLSGLYGPGRTWMVEQVRSGLLALGPGDEVWLNSCHQEDAATTVLAALDHGRPGAVYHATDAVPMRRREVITFLTERLGMAPAVRAAHPGSTGPGSTGPGSTGPDRRIRGERTRTELGIRLHWPSLREGLAPFTAAGSDPVS